MKSIQELEKILVKNLVESFDRIKSNPYVENYNYNKILVDVSFILCGILESHLKANVNEWDSKKWLDDCLLTKAKLIDYKILIWGIVIWGREETTKQWTDPLFCELTFNQNFTNFNDYRILFGDLDTPEVTYEEFRKNRLIWDKEFYKDDSWNQEERNWKYTVKSE